MQKSISKRFLPCFSSSLLLFCSRRSFQFEVASLAQKAQILFKSEADYLKITEPLKHSGVDVTKCVFKLELYKSFNINSALLKLNAFKKLDEKGLNFNLFIFVDNYKNLQKFLKIVNFLNFKKSNVVRVYHCLEVDYKILCAINFLNLFDEKNLHSKEVKMGTLKPLNVLKKLPNSFKVLCEKHISLIDNNDTFCFDNFEYKDFCFESKKFSKSCEFTLTKSYDYELCCKIYRLKINNNSMQFLPFILNLGTIFNKNMPKNSICVCEQKNGGYIIQDKVTDNIKCFYGKNLQVFQNKNQDICVIKKFILNPQQEFVFYFAEFSNKRDFNDFFNKQNLVKFDIKIEDLFNKIFLKYSNFDLPKINADNKTLNYLVNFYLPQKIIKNFIFDPVKNSKDFWYLFDQKFQPTLINKKFIEGNLSKFFLLNSNLFTAYENLLYFYAGAFCDKEGVNLNTDKSLLFNNCSLNFTNSKKRKTLIFKNFQLNGEVKINNIRYTNLKFLKLQNMQDEIEVFY